MNVKINSRRPRSSSQRFQSYLSRSSIESGFEKGLTSGCIKKSGGRNCYGRITTRHRGGGADRKYRLIDFYRSERAVSGVVKAIHYDPNRNVPIALIVYSNGRKEYMLLPNGVKVNDRVAAGVNVDAVVGNCMPIKNIPIGFVIHNVEICPNRGGRLVRSAGAGAQIVNKDGNYALVKLPSGEVRMISLDCWATIGEVSHSSYKNISIGKAGRSRWMGRRPSVRGMAMNPVDHPHGGGEGRSKSGKNPVSPWGKCCKGMKTRKRSSRFIVSRRK
jgi:large subunit ribosomal protein L2